jgi:hypothetical protein
MLTSAVAAGFIAAMPPFVRIEPVLSITSTSSMPRSSRLITVRADTVMSFTPATFMKRVGMVAQATIVTVLSSSSKVMIGWPGASWASM